MEKFKKKLPIVITNKFEYKINNYNINVFKETLLKGFHTNSHIIINYNN